MPGRIGRSYARYRQGSAAFKVDFAIQGHIPWTNPDCGRAGTVRSGWHVRRGRGHRTSTRARQDGAAAVCARRASTLWPTPPGLAGGINPIWAYAHVPFGYTGDATAAVVDQIERFAPDIPRPHRRDGQQGHRRSSRPTTPTSSAATSSAAPTTGYRSSCGRASPSIRMRPCAGRLPAFAVHAAGSRNPRPVWLLRRRGGPGLGPQALFPVMFGTRFDVYRRPSCTGGRSSAAHTLTGAATAHGSLI